MKPERWAGLSDTHCPHHDRGYVPWFIEQIEQHKPQHIIFGGDGIDCNAASRWPNEYSHTLSSECDAFVADVLVPVRKAAPPGCKLVWIYGNHEDNSLRPNRIPKDLRDMVDIRAYINEKHDHEADRWLHVPYKRHPIKGVYRIGQASFLHSHETSDAGIKQQAVVMNNRDPFSVTIHGHTHRPTPHPVQIQLGKTRLPHWDIDIGCGIDFEQPMEYIERQRMDLWGQACVIGESVPLKSPRKAREWDAEVRIRKMASDWDVADWKYAHA